MPAASPSTVPQMCRAGKETKTGSKTEEKVVTILREKKSKKTKERKKVRKTKAILLESEVPFRNPIRLSKVPTLLPETCIVDTRGFEV